jgi:hypothetical protein
MARDRRTTLLAFARIWAYPLWCSVIHSKAADNVAEDVDWWMRCINHPDLLALDRYSPIRIPSRCADRVPHATRQSCRMSDRA